MSQIVRGKINQIRLKTDKGLSESRFYLHQYALQSDGVHPPLLREEEKSS